VRAPAWQTGTGAFGRRRCRRKRGRPPGAVSSPDRFFTHLCCKDTMLRRPHGHRDGTSRHRRRRRRQARQRPRRVNGDKSKNAKVAFVGVIYTLGPRGDDDRREPGSASATLLLPTSCWTWTGQIDWAYARRSGFPRKHYSLTQSSISRQASNSYSNSACVIARSNDSCQVSVTHRISPSSRKR